MMRTRVVFGLMAVALVVALPARAATITVYTSEALWAAAQTGSLSLENFSDTTLVEGLTSITGSHVSISGGVLNDQVNDDFATSTTFAFSPSILSFGATWNLTGPGGAGTGITVYVDFDGGGSQTVGVFAADGFWGFVSDMPIFAVRLSEDSSLGGPGTGVETYNMDNLQFQAVPEPATLLLLGTGLGAVAARRRLRKRA